MTDSRVYCDLSTVSSLFEVQLSEKSGLASSADHAEEILREYETATTTKFACYKVSKGFGSTDVKAKNHKILWGDDLVPYMVVNHKVYDCQHGVDRHLSEKRKNKLNTGGDHLKSGKLVQDSTKLNCPAQVHMREILKYTYFKIPEMTEWRRKSQSKKLRKALEDGHIKSERWIHVELPSLSDHTIHPTGNAGGIHQRIDDRLIKKTQDLVSEGARSVREVRRHLKIFVEQELYRGKTSPPRTNLRFFPTKATVRNHIYKAVVKERFSKFDQEEVTKKIELWKLKSPDDNFMFRPYAEYAQCAEEDADDISQGEEDDAEEIVQTTTAAKGLLFAHQSKYQQRLLKRYGNEITLLDATYKTTKYSLPLFFVAVKTNVDYQVVASFVIQNETSDSIYEALAIIKSWNSEWKPAYFMVDYSEEEMSAISRLFPDALVYICDFHREQAWERWLAKNCNGLSDCKPLVLAQLRAVARARTETDFRNAVAALKCGTPWKTNPTFRNWMEKTWLPKYKKWVWAFRKDRFLTMVNTNNGVERQNKAFKYEYLDGYKHSTLSGMLTVLIDDFLPDKYFKYVELNTKLGAGYRRYNSNIPDYLKERPHNIIKHCLERLSLSEDIAGNSVEVFNMKEGIFKVGNKGARYMVSFGEGSGHLGCDCVDWEKNRLSCKHFFAVFRHVPAWPFERLPNLYRNSPFFTLDKDVCLVNEFTDDSNNELLDEPVDLEQTDSCNRPRTQDIPKAKSRPRTSASKCRELLNQIKNMTYIAESWEKADILVQLYDKLQDCLVLLTEATPKENGLVLEAPPTRQKPTAIRGKSERKGKGTKLAGQLHQLPLASKKNPYTGRCGAKANSMKRNMYVSKLDEMLAGSAPSSKKRRHHNSVIVDGLVENDILIDEEEISNHDDFAEVNEIKIDDPLKTEDNDVDVDDDEGACHKDDEVDDAGACHTDDEVDDAGACHTDDEHDDESDGHKDEVDDDDDDDVQYVRTEQSSTSYRNKRPRLVLSATERNTISNNRMLTDESINIAQNLLSAQFPSLQGLENSTLGPVGGFSVFRGNFIQILHTGRTHWVCCSNNQQRKPDTGEIDYYDSLSRGALTINTKQQIAQFLNCSEPELTINITAAQQQTNGTNCGVIAIAYATSLAFQHDPATISYDERALRSHLLKCFDENRMTPFPTLSLGKKRCPRKVIQVEVLCSCRMPWNSSTRNTDKRMAECNGCKQWFHQVCEDIPEQVFNEEQEWVCSTCSES